MSGFMKVLETTCKQESMIRDIYSEQAFSSSYICEIGEITQVINSGISNNPKTPDIKIRIGSCMYYGLLCGRNSPLGYIIDEANVGKKIAVAGRLNKKKPNVLLISYVSFDLVDKVVFAQCHRPKVAASVKTVFNDMNFQPAESNAFGTDKLADRIKNEIQKRSKYTNHFNDEIGYSENNIFTLKELKEIYNYTKSTYPIATQHIINDLIEQTSRDSFRNSRDDETKSNILYTLLSISQACAPVTKNRAEMKAELDKHICFRESEKRALTEVLCTAKRKNKGASILLVGSDGTGKQLIADTVGHILGKHTVSLPYYSYTTLMDISGVNSSYSKSGCGQVGTQFASLKSTDIVMVFQGIDMANSIQNKDGIPETCLVSMLRDGLYSDAFWGVSVNCSATTIIATAESTDNITESVVRSFDKVIYLTEYTNEEKLYIGKNVIFQNISKELAVDPAFLELQLGNHLEYIVDSFCYDEGVDALEKNIKVLSDYLIEEGYEESSNRLTRETIDIVLNKENLINDPATCIYMNKDKFDKGSYDILRRMISESNKKGEDGALAKKQIDSIATIFRKDSDTFHFDYDGFIKATNETHSGMMNVKNTFACVFNHIKRSGNKADNILIVSAPGQGKTTLTRSSANAVGLPYFKISCNGANSSEFFKGTPSYISDGGVGMIVKALETIGLHGVILLDEIDKIHPSAMPALLDLLDEKEFSCSYFDGVKLNLSSVVFIASANYIENIPPELIDRFTTVYMKNYSKLTQKTIFKSHILPSVIKENNAYGIKFSEEAIDTLFTDYIYTTGARQLKANAKKIVEQILLKNEKYVVTSEDVRDIIGEPIHKFKIDFTDLTPGKVNGLAVSGGGFGMITQIDCVHSAEDIVTGLVEGSAAESIKVARTVLELFEPCFDKHYHVHFGTGENGIKKDGSSAGISLFFSMLSCERNIAVDPYCAFTGELDVHGKVYAIGGEIEKIQAAMEAGCTKVYIPASNYQKLSKDELAEFEGGIEIIPVQNVRDIINQVFVKEKIDNTFVA